MTICKNEKVEASDTLSEKVFEEIWGEIDKNQAYLRRFEEFWRKNGKWGDLRSFEEAWEPCVWNRNVISSLPKDLEASNLAQCWLKLRGSHIPSHVSLWSCCSVENWKRYISISITTISINVDRMVTEGFPLTKYYDPWSGGQIMSLGELETFNHHHYKIC